MITVIVDEIGEVVASMRNLSAADAAKFGVPAGLESPYYFYGSPIDMNKQMIDRDQASTKGKVYPAIALRLPATWEMSGGLMKFTLNVAILDQTELNYLTPKRFDEVIKPVIYPLYDLFLDRLKKHGFTWEGNQKAPPHTGVDRPHHGVEETQGNKAYVFSKKLDAIELINLKVNYKSKKC